MTATKSEPTAEPKLTARQRAVWTAASVLTVPGQPAPTPAEIADRLKLTEEQVRTALDALFANGRVVRGKVAGRGAP